MNNNASYRPHLGYVRTHIQLHPKTITYYMQAFREYQYCIVNAIKGKPVTKVIHPDHSLKLKFPLTLIICFIFEFGKFSST